MKSNQMPISVRYCGNASDGKRAYKITGTFSLSNINGGVVSGDAVFDNTTLYPNPHMTLTPEGYTKHYFAGAERIGTTQGGGNHGNWLVNPLDNLTQAEQVCLNDLSDGTIYQKNYYEYYDYPHHSSQTENTDYTGTVTSQDNTYPDYQYKEAETFLGELSICFKSMLSEHLEGYYLKDEVDEPFYYHSDHLGSAAWITDGQGLPVQYIMYAPYGELLLNQQAGTYDERFKFTGKERDEETGYDYFGARYYLPFTSIFGSVDPLADKNIELSSYMYCRGNPIKFVDPDGMDEEQREAALNLAHQYVKMNPGDSYKWGGTGGPGQPVDCSGLASKCAIAGGEKNPNRGQYNGVHNIANNTQKIENVNDIEAGNFVIFNTGGKYGDYSHIGIITEVIRDEEGNVVDFQFIHSGSKGPTITYGSMSSNNKTHKSWKSVVTGFYKWDTKPDTYNLPEITIWGHKPSWQNPIRMFNVSPIPVYSISYIKK